MSECVRGRAAGAEKGPGVPCRLRYPGECQPPLTPGVPSRVLVPPADELPCLISIIWGVLLLVCGGGGGGQGCSQTSYSAQDRLLPHSK